MSCGSGAYVRAGGAARWTARWTAAAIALGVWAWRRYRRRRAAAGIPAGQTQREPFPYAPAILVGALLALVVGAGT
jgi:hypothetical protein